tara:strand:- start:1592 stop:3679 length:2088 start_codon:yes stop_codon:yes gene_type:complete
MYKDRALLPKVSIDRPLNGVQKRKVGHQDILILLKIRLDVNICTGMTNDDRSTPWVNLESTLKAFLTECGTITIPMNQRYYIWAPCNIEQFLDDLDDILKSTTKMCFGNVIQFRAGDGDKQIWDGQQRIITAILFLVACRNFLKNIFPLIDPDHNTKSVEKIVNRITKVVELDTDEDLDLDEDSSIILPRVRCVSPRDKLILSEIFNDYEPLTNHQNQSSSIDGKIQCRHCDEVITGERNDADFRRHLIKTCKKISPDSRSKMKTIEKNIGKVKKVEMLHAYELISYYIVDNCKTLNHVNERVGLILNDYLINVKTCSSLEYVSKLYNFENNRGQQMQTIDVVKNYILTNIPDDKKEEIFEKWDKLKNQKEFGAPIYGEYGYKVFKSAIQIYNKHIIISNHKLYEEEDFKQLIDYNDKQITYNNTIKYLKIVEDSISYMRQIGEDRFGRLVLHRKKGVTFSWEAFAYTILPKCSIDGGIDSDFIKKLVTWQMYVTCFGFRDFNNLTYSQKFAPLITRYMNEKFDKEELNEEIYQTLGEIFSHNSQMLTNIVKHQQFKQAGIAKIKGILAFLETITTSSINRFDLDGIDHEHIVSQGCKDILTNGKLINSWGNITLLESKNTKNVQTGNRGVKTSMSKKKESYTNSSLTLTKKIVDEYPEFFERDDVTENPDSFYDKLIQKREDDIIKKCIEYIKF